MWKQCAEGLSGATCQTGSAQTFTWANALAHAEASTFANYTDWRLPNVKELSSLVEDCRVSRPSTRTASRTPRVRISGRVRPTPRFEPRVVRGLRPMADSPNTTNRSHALPRSSRARRTVILAADSDSVNPGSNPGPPANMQKAPSRGLLHVDSCPKAVGRHSHADVRGQGHLAARDCRPTQGPPESRRSAFPCRRAGPGPFGGKGLPPYARSARKP
jgi:hypothetical protein